MLSGKKPVRKKKRTRGKEMEFDSDDNLPIKDLKCSMLLDNKIITIRKNIIEVLTKTTLMPFRWLRSSFRCFYCYDVFKEPKDLKSHQVDHSVKHEIFKVMENYWDPELYVDVSNISCDLCPETITDLYHLIDHLIKMHDVKYNKDFGLGMTPFRLDEISVHCLICDRRFRTFGHLLVHTNKDHKGWSQVLCDICGQHFRNDKYLRQHIRSDHTNKSVLCPICGLSIISKNKLRTHLQNFHNHKYKCFACPEKFETHYKRSQHMMLVHKSRDIVKCSSCPKTFVYRSTMMRHVRETHLQEKTAICTVCGWKAFGHYGLQKHMMKHSNERNFKCSVCEKPFKTKKTLKQHYNNIHQKSRTLDKDTVEIYTI